MLWFEKAARYCTSPCSSAGRPAGLRLGKECLRIGGKGVAIGLKPEQIKPLVHHHPEKRIASHSDAARHIDGIVAAELRPIDFRMGEERGAVPLIMEAPDYPALNSRKPCTGAPSTK